MCIVAEIYVFKTLLFYYLFIDDQITKCDIVFSWRIIIVIAKFISIKLKMYLFLIEP